MASVQTTVPKDPDGAADVVASSHARTIDAVASAIGVDPASGHDDPTVDEMRRKYGGNAIPESKPRSRVLLFLEQFNNPLIYILFGAAVLTILVSDWLDAVTIFVVVVFNAAIGYFQEQRAAERLKAVKSLTAPTARVIRGNTQQVVPADDLVLGDIVLLESGVRVPADLRLVDTADLTIDESMLTGESVPTDKVASEVHQHRTPIGDRSNMAYGATIVRRGRGRGMVVGLGPTSELGRISKGIAEAQETRSPLQERLASFGKLLAVAIAVAIALIFIVGLLRGYPATTMLLTAIGLAVSAIPEGLPIAVTVALSIGVYRMARQSAVVRKLAAVETLGSTTVVCSDKTGTLTRNQMSVMEIATDDRIYHVTGGGYEPVGRIEDDAHNEVSVKPESPLHWTLRVGLLCTESSFVDGERGRELVGDPTEGALIVAAEKARIAGPDRANCAGGVVLPFESERMYMVSEITIDEHHYYLAKGSVEKILGMCTRELRAEGIVPLDEAWIQERQVQLSERGLRVIAACFFPTGDGPRPDPQNIHEAIFAGMFGIEDPPRPEVKTAIEDAHHAGIKVAMITGDHVKTAVAIASQLNLSEGRRIRAIDGAQLEELDDEDLFERVNGTDVYARVAPEHKLRIVRQLQAHGHVIAMTGDGVNDAPALKQADIGIAMGSGTDVAKEASSLVVQDDNFATIVQAIRYGRVMYRNLQHMVLYVLCTSAGGVLTLTAAVVLGFPLPLLAVQLLWINLVTDGTSTIPLAYEKEHGDIMATRPRDRREGLVNWEMGERIIISALLMMFGTLVVFEVLLGRYGLTAFSPDIPEAVLVHARTAAFATLALFQIWNVHNSRSLEESIFSIGLFSNRPLLYVTLLALVLQVAAVELPFMHPLMKTTHLPLEDWILCVGVSFTLVVFVEFRKWARRFYLGMRQRREAAGHR